MNDLQSPSESSAFVSLLWSSDEATQFAIGLVLAFALVAFALVYAPLVVRLIRIAMLDRAVRAACRQGDRQGHEHREEIAAAFNDSPLSWHWEEFVFRWRSAQNEAQHQRAPVRLIEVLDERPLLPIGPRRSLLPALPGLFLAVGILGTFVGLTEALGSGAIGAAADSPDVAPGFVATQVGLALRTSLWGMLLAIGAVTAGRLLEGGFERLADSLDQWVERAYGSISPAESAHLADLAQRESFERMGGELTRFSNDLSERMDRGLQRIEQSTSSAAALVSEDQRDVLQSIVRELSLQIQRGVEQHLGALHGLLDRSIEHQGTVTGGLAETFDLMATNSAIHSRVTETLEQAAQSMQLAAAQMSGTARDFTPVLERLQDTGIALHDTATTMAGTQATVERSAQGMRDALENAAAALGEQHEFIENGIGEIRATIDAMSRGLGENLTHALRSVDDALSHTVGRLRETIAESNETIDRMTGPVRAAEGTTREMHTALERVRSELMGLGEWLTQAIKPMRHTLTQLEDKTGDITRALTDFGDNTHSVDKTMEALRNEIHDEGRRFRTSTAELVRHLAQASSAFGGADVLGLDDGTPSETPPRFTPPPASPEERGASVERAAPRARAASRYEVDPNQREDEPAELDVTPLPSQRAAAIRRERQPGAPGPVVPMVHKPKNDPPPPILAPAPSADAPAPTSHTPAPPVHAPAPPVHAPAPPLHAPAPPVHAPAPPVQQPAPTQQGGAVGAPPAPPPRAPESSDTIPAKAGRALGPDPYARLERTHPSFLASTDDAHPAARIATGRKEPGGPDDLSLSGLLGSRPAASGNRSASPAPPDDDVIDEAGDEQDEGDRSPEPDGERPRTWRFLGKQ